MINKKSVNINAMFYAFCYLFGLRIKGVADNYSSREELDSHSRIMMEFFDKFGKDERPFGVPKQEWNNFELVPKSKSYSLRNIPYRQLYEDMNSYRKEQKIDEALNCAKMKQFMTLSLTGRVDLITLADIAEMALE